MSISPKVKQVEVGIRTTRVVKIYPLSLADQLKLGDLITEAVSSFLEKRQSMGAQMQKISEGGEASAEDTNSNVAFVNEMLELVKDNIHKILALVTDEEEAPTFEEMDNEQLVEIVDLIFLMNYEGAAKNVQSLLRRAKEAFGLKKSQPDSSAGTLSTD